MTANQIKEVKLDKTFFITSIVLACLLFILTILLIDYLFMRKKNCGFMALIKRLFKPRRRSVQYHPKSLDIEMGAKHSFKPLLNPLKSVKLLFYCSF